MRFLLIFILVIFVFAGAIAAFVLPSEQWQAFVAKLPPEWSSTDSDGLPTGDDGPTTPVNISAQSLTTAAPAHLSIRKADGIAIGDWLYDCEDDRSEGQKPCVIAYQVTNQSGGQVQFSWLIGADAEGKFQSVWQTPTGVLVNRGVVLDAGTEKPIALPFTACVTGFCEAVANLAPDFIETLLSAQKATATVYTVSGDALTFPISIDGLADGIIALRNQGRQG